MTIFYVLTFFHRTLTPFYVLSSFNTVILTVCMNSVIMSVFMKIVTVTIL